MIKSYLGQVAKVQYRILLQQEYWKRLSIAICDPSLKSVLNQLTHQKFH